MSEIAVARRKRARRGGLGPLGPLLLIGGGLVAGAILIRGGAGGLFGRALSVRFEANPDRDPMTFLFAITPGGGSAPYNAIVDFGDGTQTGLFIKSDGETVYTTRVYEAQGIYRAVVDLTDAKGGKAVADKLVTAAIGGFQLAE